MNRKAVSGIMLTTLLVGIFAFSIQLPKASGTIYINYDGSVTGTGEEYKKIQRDGDIYTFTDNIYDSIVVESDNAIIDGANYTLEGIGSGRGISLLNTIGVTIKNMEVKVFDSGIYLEDSTSCRIYETNVTTTRTYGVYLIQSSSSIISGNNVLSNNVWGIYGSSSSNNTLSWNTIMHNGNDGISLYSSSNNTLSGNTITHNQRGIFLSGFSDNNVLSGNTIRYNYVDGISLGSSSNNALSGNTITDNDFEGIYLYGSSNNALSGNTITDNDLNGIRLYDSSNNNVLSGNTITNNGFDGINLDRFSDNNVLSGNTIRYNSDGIYLDYHSINNALSGNTITNNNYGIRLYDSSNNNVLSGNNITNNGRGIELYESSNNTLSENTITHNQRGIRLQSSSNNNVLSGNTITNNKVGIEVEGTSSNSSIYQNNLFNNEVQTLQNDLNNWDNEQLGEGNYWSDYEGVDLNGDGIGDTELPHNKDRYPFIVPIGLIPVFLEEVRYDCSFRGNTTVSMFDFDQIQPSKSIGFNITLPATTRYCNVIVPRTLLDGQFNVLIDNSAIASILSWNDTHTSIYFTCNEEGTHKVEITAYCAIKTCMQECACMPDASMEFNVVSSFIGDCTLTVPRTALDGQFKVMVDDVVIPSILSWDKDYTTIYFACGEEGSHNVKVIADMATSPDINKDDVVDIFDVVGVAKYFGETR